MKRFLLSLILVVVAGTAYSLTVTNNNFVSGQPIVSAEIDQNFDEIDTAVTDLEEGDEIFYATNYTSGSTTYGMQEAYDACVTNEGGIVQLPQGELQINAAALTGQVLDFPGVDNGNGLMVGVCRVQGYGAGATINNDTGTDVAGTEIHINNFDSMTAGADGRRTIIRAEGDNQILEGFSLKYNGTLGATYAVLFLDGANGAQLYDIVTRHQSGTSVGIGIEMVDSEKSSMTNVWVADADIALRLSNGTATNNGLSVVSSVFKSSNTGVYIEGDPTNANSGCASDITFTGTIIEDNLIGLDFESDSSCVVSLFGVHMEGAATATNIRINAGKASVQMYGGQLGHDSATYNIERTTAQDSGYGPDNFWGVEWYTAGSANNVSAGEVYAWSPVLRDGVPGGGVILVDPVYPAGTYAWTGAHDFGGTVEIQDDTEFNFGNDADWTLVYDVLGDDQLLLETTATGSTIPATTDPMFEILVGTTPVADQQVFGVAKGTQSSNTPLFTLDEDGDVYFLGDLTAASLQTTASATPSYNFDDSDDTGTVDGSINVNCPTTNDCDMEFAVDSSTDTEEVMMRIDTETGGASTVTFGVGTAGNIPTDRVEISETGVMSFSGAGGLAADSVDSADINTIVQSMYWGAGAMSADGTQCAAPAEVTIGSWGKQYAVICADNDASTITGSTHMPDGWDAGTVTFALSYIQDAADTSALNADVAARCAGTGETPAAYGTEIAIDDAAVTGTDAIDITTSAAVTAAGTCAAGDYLQWQVQLDATGTTTAAATLNIVGVKMEYTSNVGD